MKFTGIIFNNKFLKNFFLSLGALIVFFLIVLLFLKFYTRHGKNYIVGGYIGLNYTEIISDPSNDRFEFVIIDSIYDNEREGGSVVSQTPLPDSKVKNGRKIYLTIVASQPEMVSCPNLQDLTVRQATTVLETYGIKVGRIEFVPDIGNTVIRWKQMGKTVSPGDKLVKGSRIDLAVGSGEGQGNTYLPDLIGNTRDEARGIINGAGLNIGSEFFLNKNDTVSVRVVKQFPAYSNDYEISLGSVINLWYE